VNITKYGLHTLAIAFSLTATTSFATENTNKNTPQANKMESSAIPPAEQNKLQEVPQYTDAKKQMIESIALQSSLKQKTLIIEDVDYKPANTNLSWEQFDVSESFYDSPYQVSLFSPQNGEDGERLWSQTSSIFYYGLGIITILAVMPEEITNWDGSGDANLGQKWIDNVTAGPVWDRDDVGLNFVMHPYFGGVYYQSARKSGYRQWDSFLYATVMSTFFWEYGVEAFAETPSMQDLVVTPVLGWVYGEWAFNTEREIWADGGTVWGSEYLGNTTLFLLDPVDSIGRNVNRLFGTDLIKAGTGYVKLSEESTPGGFQNEKQISFEINYTFGEENSAAQPGISGKRRIGESYSFSNPSDPVDYSIIGFTLGTGYLNFDGKRDLVNEQYAQASLGLYFTRSFSARLNYSSTKMMKEIVKPEVVFESFSVDGQYYFNVDSDFRPYVTAGLGEEIWEEDDEQYNFQMNTGLGIHYRLNANWAVQAELVNYYTTDEKSNDQQLTGKLVYRFGKGESDL